MPRPSRRSSCRAVVRAALSTNAVLSPTHALPTTVLSTTTSTATSSSRSARPRHRRRPRAADLPGVGVEDDDPLVVEHIGVDHVGVLQDRLDHRPETQLVGLEQRVAGADRKRLRQAGGPLLGLLDQMDTQIADHGHGDQPRHRRQQDADRGGDLPAQGDGSRHHGPQPAPAAGCARPCSHESMSPGPRNSPRGRSAKSLPPMWDPSAR